MAIRLQDLERVRSLVIRDPAALDKWGLVADQLVSISKRDRDPPPERRLIDDHLYPDAIRRTLRLWYEINQGDLSSLVSLLLDNGLDRLVDRIMKEFSGKLDLPMTNFKCPSSAPNNGGGCSSKRRCEDYPSDLTSAKVPKVEQIDRKDLIKIRDIIIQDSVALQKWPSVVDHILGPNSAADVLRIKTLMTRYGDYEESVLQTLGIWYQENADGLKGLLDILGRHGLRAVSDKIQEEFRTAPAGEHALAERPSVWFEVGDSVANFAGRSSELDQLHTMLTRSHNTKSSARNVICVCGLGGIGKSSLVREYAHNRKEFYERNVIWILAESLDSVKASFNRLADRMGLEIATGIQNEELAALVFEKFENRKCLFIFDNVEDTTQFKQFQPKIVDPCRATPYVLVTSRTRDLFRIPENQLDLQGLTSNDAVRFIQTQLPESTENGARRLALMLEMFPLALQQAVAFTQDVLGQDDDAISEYLMEYDRCATALLRDDRFQDNNDYSLTTFTTWCVTLKRIEGVEGGEASIRLINTLSYLNPDRISVHFLTRVFYEMTRPSLRLLNKFSMIGMARGLVVIHRLVQEVIRRNPIMSRPRGFVELVNFLRLDLRAADSPDLMGECIQHGMHLTPDRVNDPYLLEAQDYRDYLNLICETLEGLGDHATCLSFAQCVAAAWSERGIGEESLRMKMWGGRAHLHLKNFREVMGLLEYLYDYESRHAGIAGGERGTLPPDLYMDLRQLTARSQSTTGDHTHALKTIDQLIEFKMNNLSKGVDTAEKGSVILNYFADKAAILYELNQFNDALYWAELVCHQRAKIYGVKNWRTIRARDRLASMKSGKTVSNAFGVTQRLTRPPDFSVNPTASLD